MISSIRLLLRKSRLELLPFLINCHLAQWIRAWVDIDLIAALLVESGVFLSSGAGSRPAATHFLLLRQNKVSKEKATRSLGPFGQPALIEKSGGPRKLAALKQRAALIPLFSIITGPARTGWDRIRIRTGAN
jgi:hypothetical protein